MTSWQATVVTICAGMGVGLLYHISTKVEEAVRLLRRIAASHEGVDLDT